MLSGANVAVAAGRGASVERVIGVTIEDAMGVVTVSLSGLFLPGTLASGLSA